MVREVTVVITPLPMATLMLMSTILSIFLTLKGSTLLEQSWVIILLQGMAMIPSMETAAMI